MLPEAEDLLERLRALPESERSELIERALEDEGDADAQPSPKSDEAWGRVVDERMRAFDAGQSRTYSWDEVRSGVRRK